MPPQVGAQAQAQPSAGAVGIEGVDRLAQDLLDVPVALLQLRQGLDVLGPGVDAVQAGEDLGAQERVRAHRVQAQQGFADGELGIVGEVELEGVHLPQAQSDGPGIGGARQPLAQVGRLGVEQGGVGGEAEVVVERADPRELDRELVGVVGVGQARAVLEGGDYVMQTYNRTLSDMGMALEFISIENGETARRVEGRLTKRSD